MKSFDAENYTISVRKEVVEGEELFVARVAELPDVCEFADSANDARGLAKDTIETAYDLCMQKGIPFPEPKIVNDDLVSASGRVTLRMPKTLHTKLIEKAEEEDISLNQLIVSALSMNYGQYQATKGLVDELKDMVQCFRDGVDKYHTAFMVRTMLQYTHAEQSKWSGNSGRFLF